MDTTVETLRISYCLARARNALNTLSSDLHVSRRSTENTPGGATFVRAVYDDNLRAVLATLKWLMEAIDTKDAPGGVVSGVAGGNFMSLLLGYIGLYYGCIDEILAILPAEPNTAVMTDPLEARGVEDPIIMIEGTSIRVVEVLEADDNEDELEGAFITWALSNAPAPLRAVRVLRYEGADKEHAFLSILRFVKW
ncbi:hypothetical protein CERSUDRAFT_96050 [Gelatoporia subvermispora B]|uniref:Uncharacterized protein n=1 Tax=Ceriporiopsis subvermispora (strain B) TaxID=914234 RepID=M2RBP3_CERS8|nr:hypothetical protein CERSUDRAFT_96050 [Gelatoporia subvermispora B]